jgi:hypothetical protein
VSVYCLFPSKVQFAFETRVKMFHNYIGYIHKMIEMSAYWGYVHLCVRLRISSPKPLIKFVLNFVCNIFCKVCGMNLKDF